MSQSSGEPLLYALYAVLVHHGINCRTGHYVCYMKVEVNIISNTVKGCAGKPVQVLLVVLFLGKKISLYVYLTRVYFIAICDFIWKTCNSSKDIVVFICRLVMDFGIR